MTCICNGILLSPHRRPAPAQSAWQRSCDKTNHGGGTHHQHRTQACRITCICNDILRSSYRRPAPTQSVWRLGCARANQEGVTDQQHQFQARRVKSIGNDRLVGPHTVAPAPFSQHHGGLATKQTIPDQPARSMHAHRTSDFSPAFFSRPSGTSTGAASQAADLRHC